MAILKIARLGEPVLRQRAEELPVDQIASRETQRLIDDLIETMRDAGGAGLAAPQVYVSVRIFVVEVDANARYPYKPPIPLRVVINPELAVTSDERFANYEGCLSVPDLRGIVGRYRTIELSYTNRAGGRVREAARGLSAGTFQHELDHLNGTMFLDRVADPRSFTGWREFRRYRQAEWLQQIADVVRESGVTTIHGETPLGRNPRESSV